MNQTDDIIFDNNGRITGWRGSLNFGFRSFPNAVKLTTDAPQQRQIIIDDCRSAFTARSARTKSYSEGDTFWLPADAMDKPRFGLEHLAADIFNFHTKNVASFDRTTSGAEWWTLVLDDAQNSDVGFHWDKDYTVEAERGLNVFPILSTVTYLSDIGAPTLVLDKTAPVQFKDSFIGNSSTAWLSRPRFAKHISFDGRYLHGAPSDLISLWSEKNNSSSRVKKNKKEALETRVSFLVNMWLNHKPVGAVSCPQSLITQMKAPVNSVKMMIQNKDESTPDEIVVNKSNEDEVGVKQMRWSFKQAKKHTVVVPVPLKSLAQGGDTGNDSFVMHFRSGLKAQVL
jgi:hypothetical protein